MEPLTAKFRSTFVRISTEEGIPVGVGFLVSKDGHVLTCAHVVATALGDDSVAARTEVPQGILNLNFHFLEGQPRRRASIVGWQPRSGPETNLGGDIAVLQIDEDLPDAAQPICLAVTGELFNLEFRAHGFPRDSDGGVWAYGVVRDPLGNGWLQVEDTKEQGRRIERGFSGGPVQDLTTGRFVGMVAASSEYVKTAKVAYVIPTQVLARAHPSLNLDLDYPERTDLSDVTQLDATRQMLFGMPLNRVPSPAPLPAGSYMPLSSNRLFVGREEEHKAIATCLKADSASSAGPVVIAAATGLGGVGKTQLASEFVHCYGQYFAGGVFWLTFADADAVPAQVAACGGAGGMRLRPDFHALPFADQVREVRSTWQSVTPRLLVFDNCEDQNLLDQWRPTTGGCRILVTSRREHWDPTLGVKTFRLNVLSRNESVALMRKHRADLTEDDPDLDAIAQELGDLPLAIDLAGRYLARYRFVITANRYLEELRRKDILEHRSLQEGGLSPTDHEQHVARTFALSYERLETGDPTDAVAVALLARAARLASGEPVPRDLLISTLKLSDDDPEEILRAEDALGKLTELGFLETVQETALRMHRLVSLFALSKAEDEGAQRAVEVGLVETIRPFLEAGSLVPLLPYFPHLRAVSEAARQREDEWTAVLFSSLATCLELTGSYDESRHYSEQVLAIHVKIDGEASPRTAQSFHNLALIRKKQGAYDEARRLYERALQIRRKTLGAEHPATASTLSNLGVLLKEQKSYDEAQSFYEKALDIRERTLGEEHPETAQTLNNLANVYKRRRMYDQASSLLQRALEAFEKAYGREHARTAAVLTNLADVRRDQGKLDEAQDLYGEVYDIREKTLGEEHPETAQVLNALALLRDIQGDFDEARRLYEKALMILEKTLGKDHSHTTVVRVNLEHLIAEQATRSGPES